MAVKNQGGRPPVTQRRVARNITIEPKLNEQLIQIAAEHTNGNVSAIIEQAVVEHVNRVIRRGEQVTYKPALMPKNRNQQAARAEIEKYRITNGKRALTTA